LTSGVSIGPPARAAPWVRPRSANSRMDAASFSTRNHLAQMAETSWFDLFGRTSPRLRPTLNSHSPTMEARPGKSTGSLIRRECRMNLTKRTELGRFRARGSHDWETIKQILDTGFLAHVGFCVNGQPFVIPTLYGRDGERLYLHGAAASRMLGELETGILACVSVTLVDGLVLARSAFDHSMNYRSVVAFGTARKVAEPEHKLKALRVISEHLIAGRWEDVREPSQKELKAT